MSGRYKPNRFLHAIRCPLNLSSGENRAGCALSVLFFSGVSFCGRRNRRKSNSEHRVAKPNEHKVHGTWYQSDSPYLQRVDALAFAIEIIHQMHGATYFLLKPYGSHQHSYKAHFRQAHTLFSQRASLSAAIIRTGILLIAFAMIGGEVFFFLCIYELQEDGQKS